MTGPFMPADPNHAIWKYQHDTGTNIAKDGLPPGHGIRHSSDGGAYICGSISFQSAGAGFFDPTPVDWQHWNRYLKAHTVTDAEQDDLGDLWVE